MIYNFLNHGFKEYLMVMKMSLCNKFLKETKKHRKTYKKKHIKMMTFWGGEPWVCLFVFHLNICKYFLNLPRRACSIFIIRKKAIFKRGIKGCTNIGKCVRYRQRKGEQAHPAGACGERLQEAFIRLFRVETKE